MHQISIERALGENILESLRGDWKQLFAATECSPFLAWEWLSTWYKWFGGNRDLFVIKAYRQNQLIGLLPLCLQEKRVLGLKLKRLAFIGEAQGGADYLDLIAKPEDKIEILSAILDFLKKENCFDLICLENLASDSATADFLLNFNEPQTKHRLRRAAQTTAVCPQVELSGNWETTLKQSKRASNFKRRLKQLEKMPGFEFRSVTSPFEAADAFERFYRLHEKRWLKSGGSELSGHPRLVSFQRDLVPALAQAGFIRFDELWVEGECRASVYGLDDGRAFYYYNSGYDLEWSSRSVGLVLIGLSIKNAIERGNSLYDFLRGNETYKFDWSNKQAELVTVKLSRNTVSAVADESLNAAWFKFKNLSKSALPSDFSESVKNWRRKWKRNYQLSDLEAEKTGQIV
ncbi:MAG TPA: GNAT family N-acetyltransferase [Pyrinomonadaceae bacterium]|jgi:CelD/BcsL family acetyltransferase involved in cellulose biosynthesis